MSVGHNCEPREHHMTDRDAVWRGLDSWGQINHVLDGAQIPPPGRGTFFGGGHARTCLGMPAVDILTAIRKAQHVAMRPFSIINVAT